LKYASWLFGIASAIAGILDLIWREFEPAHQPIQAWSDHIPGITFLACIAGIWLLVAGLALLIPRSAPVGACALTILYAVFCLFPLPRLISAPHYLGHHPGIYIGVFVSIGQQVILFTAAACLWLFLAWPKSNFPGVTVAARCLFGLSCIFFGLGHLTNVPGTAAMIPGWMPLGGSFWTILTGTAFLLAGVAILTGKFDVLAAQLLALMLLIFSIAVLSPRIFAAPHNHIAWGGDAYNLTAVAAAWIFAEWLANYCHPANGTRRWRIA
jgi:uncharacterized membrane protein